MEVYKKRKNPNTYHFNFYTHNPHLYCTTIPAKATIAYSQLNNISPDLAERYTWIFDSIKHGQAIDSTDGSSISFVTNTPRYKLIRICDEVMSIIFDTSLGRRDNKLLYAFTWFNQLKHVVTYSKVTAYTIGNEEDMNLYTPDASDKPAELFSPEPPTE